MEIENTDSQDVFGFTNKPFMDEKEEVTFKRRMIEYVSATITESSNQLCVQGSENEVVTRDFLNIVQSFKEKCDNIMRNASIPDSNETLLNNQQTLLSESKYLSKKFAILQDLRNDYIAEKEAWEENLHFFKHPLSLSCVEMSDCVFENINDTATLSSISDKCHELSSLLQTVKDSKDDIVQSRESLVKAYQQYTLSRWNALNCGLNPDDVSVLPPRQSIV